MNIDDLTKKADALSHRSYKVRHALVHTRFAYRFTGELKCTCHPLNGCAHQIKKLLNGVKKYLINNRENKGDTKGGNRETYKQTLMDNSKLPRITCHWVGRGGRTEKKPHVYMTQNMQQPEPKEPE